MHAATEQQAAVVALKAAAQYDLGLNYLLRARLVRSDAGEGFFTFRCLAMKQPRPTLQQLPRSAEQAFKDAIDSEPTYSEAWNGLGAVSRDALVQQHCWVRAVQLEHNPSAWANLGMLYIRWGLEVQVCLIREGFEFLHGTVTDHPTMWCGLGLLKENEA
ncbi:unnamed protein product, partial [Hapterophycus canaliculatus]